MGPAQPIRLALGGMFSMAAAIGIGRFVYTPILPVMLEAQGWSKSEAGLVASANFLGYLFGALAATHGAFTRRPRAWLMISLLVSAGSTIGMAFTSTLAGFIGLRFANGIAGAFAIVFASELVLQRLVAGGRAHLATIHFAGVGLGIAASAAIVGGSLAAGGTWRTAWMWSGLITLLAALAAIPLIAGDEAPQRSKSLPPLTRAPKGIGILIVAYGLFGFGYVITATFLAAMVRETAQLQGWGPWLWGLFGLAALPSVGLWAGLATRIGLLRAFSIACVVEAVGVAASLQTAGALGVTLAAVLVGGTFMGLTALGLMAARQLAGASPQRMIARMTASFAIGQMLGPAVAGALFDWSGSFRAATVLAALALLIAALLTNLVAAINRRSGTDLHRPMDEALR